VERDVNKKPHNTLASLQTKIMEVLACLPRTTVATAYKRFRRRLEAVVEAGDDFIE
jgi:hypothetical protein